MSDNQFRLSIYLLGFVLGFVLMGFEMLGSRFLNPWFGSGIFTWAAIISVTLFSLMVGYFAGGRLVDRLPDTRVLGVLVLLAAASMAVIAMPLGKDEVGVSVYLGPVVARMLGESAGAGATGVTLAAMAVLFVPVTLIACYSPFAVRLLLVSTDASGSQTGTVYGVSTFGNILGTWATSFWLIPSIGSAAITWWFAGITTICGLILLRIGQLQRR
ncbi:MAG: fused MFS/spermidine synthase [Pseudomonadota bacterium]